MKKAYYCEIDQKYVSDTADLNKLAIDINGHLQFLSANHGHGTMNVTVEVWEKSEISQKHSSVFSQSLEMEGGLVAGGYRNFKPVAERITQRLRARALG